MLPTEPAVVAFEASSMKDYSSAMDNFDREGGAAAPFLCPMMPDDILRNAATNVNPLEICRTSLLLVFFLLSLSLFFFFLSSFRRIIRVGCFSSVVDEFSVPFRLGLRSNELYKMNKNEH